MMKRRTTDGKTAMQKAYFVGIGGIGMSALARYFNDMGWDIYGYDRTGTALTEQLEQEGIHITYEDHPAHIPNDIDLGVYTPAIPVDNKILNRMKAMDIPLKKRAEVLGEVVRNKKTIAVAGTHGKTTTSGLTAYLLRACGIDATAVLGGIIPQFGSNYIKGTSPWVVVEADEYDRSFLHLFPDVAIVTSIDPDHLDIYGDPQTMYDTYLQFIKQVKDGGHVILHWEVADLLDNDFIQDLLNTRKVTVYGREGALGELGAISYQNEKTHFTWKVEGKPHEVEMQMPGKHNVSNAIAAMHAGMVAGAKITCLTEQAGHFSGIWRRFETRYHDGRITIIDDYAHHPTELGAAIQTARKRYPGRKITGIFQPHLYSRTRDFVKGFAEALDALDEVWILKIYPAREQPIEGVNSSMIKKNMRNANVHLATKEDILQRMNTEDAEVILVLGAGDLHLLIPSLINKIKTQ